MSKFLLLIFFSLNLFAKTFIVASYNVENLFDLKKDNSEYKEYIPNTKSKWNQKTYDIKIKNIIKVLKDMDADIVALQEVENRQLIKTLQRKLPQYKYSSFSKYKNSSVGIGFLSKIKIIKNQDINVKFTTKLFRPILETTFEIENTEFKIFNNHWPSKRVAESYRLKYAKKLFDRLNSLPKDYDYILLGDFNSNYNEFKTLYKNKELNDTKGITGINQVLNTTIDKKFVTYDDILKAEKTKHYNLWLDLDYHQRFSNKYRGQNNTPDNIIVSSSLFDNKKISYVLNSFEVFKPTYLYKNNKILRWHLKNKVHQGGGFSDHLPIFAKFTTKKEKKNPLKKIKKEELTKISQLYKKAKLINSVTLKDVIVIYKNKNSAIIKQKDDRAIYLYKNAKELKEGYSYDLEVVQIEDYYGLKEIKKFYIKKEKNRVSNYKSLYLDAKKINLFDVKYQNEIVTNLEGTFYKGKLNFNQNKEKKSIKVFAKNRSDLPKNNSYIKIKKAHLGYYKSRVQLVIYNKSDIDVN